MRVLLASRIISKTMGSERVFLATQKWLKEFGVDSILWTPDDGRLEGLIRECDVFHWFNHGGSKEAWKGIIKAVREIGIPIVATATYWPLTEGELLSGLKFLHVTPQEAASLVNARLNMDRELAEILELSDVVIATSRLELEMIRGMMAFWNRRLTRTAIIPNAVDETEILAELPEWEARPNQLIQVGRIEIAKNQLRVLSAFRWIKRVIKDATLVLIGRREPSIEEAYENLFKQDGVTVIGEVDFRIVSQIMANSKAHLLPSFRDTPGLSSLEAALCGCNLVVSDGYGTPRDYFMDQAIYVNPLNEISVVSGIERALTEKPDPRLRSFVSEYFTYSKVVPGLIKLYNMAISNRWAEQRRNQDGN